MADDHEGPVENREPDEQDEAPDAVAAKPAAAETEPGDVAAPDKPLTIGELRRRSAENANGPEAETARRLGQSLSKSFHTKGIAEKVVAASGIGESAKRMQEQIAKSTSVARAAEELTKSFRNPAIDNLARQQREMAQWREQQRVEMEDVSHLIAEAKRRQEDRADAQVEATIAIAEAQGRLQELQVRGLELATAQAEATAQVAHTQQETLAAIREELGVLRDQHAVQQRLLHSGWSGGVVMEWTLMVAIIAALASVVLGIVAANDLPPVAWWLAGVAIALASLSLAIWQRRRKPQEG